jgi:hypothetical protein
MAEISSYPIITPKAQDVLVGTETYVASVAEVLGNPTRGFTVQSIVDLAVVGTYLSVTGGTISGNLSVDGSLTLKVNSGFANISTDVTGTIFIGNSSAGVTTGLNITGDIAMQGTNASITLTSPTAAIYMTSPDGTTYKVQMANGGTFNITQL